MNRESKNPDAADRYDEWPDEQLAREAGDADPYLAEIARKSRRAGTIDTSCCTPFSSRGWESFERRGAGVEGADPYVVELTRPIRSDI